MDKLKLRIVDGCVHDRQITIGNSNSATSEPTRYRPVVLTVTTRESAADLDHPLHALDIKDARHTFDGIDNFVEVLYVKHFHGHFDVALLVVRD